MEYRAHRDWLRAARPGRHRLAEAVPCHGGRDRRRARQPGARRADRSPRSSSAGTSASSSSSSALVELIGDRRSGRYSPPCGAAGCRAVRRAHPECGRGARQRRCDLCRSQPGRGGRDRRLAAWPRRRDHRPLVVLRPRHVRGPLCARILRAGPRTPGRPRSSRARTGSRTTRTSSISRWSSA